MASYPPPPTYEQAAAGYNNPQFAGPPYNDPQKQAYPPPQPAMPAPYGASPAPYGAPPPVMHSPYGGVGVPAPEAEPEVDHDTPIFSNNSFSEKAIRRAFIRKVYLILMLQLLVTVAFICLFMFIHPLKHWIQTTGSWFYYVSYATFFVTYFVLICIPSVRRATPGNYICLGVFTLAFSYMVGTISSYYTTNSVLVAVGITALVCLSISLFAIQTKIDFTMCAGLLFVLVMVLFFFGLACLLVYQFAGYSRILDAVYGGLAALVFGLFLVYDTQMIMGGRKVEMSPEEYIYGALQLYIDVVYLFLIILSCFGKTN